MEGVEGVEGLEEFHLSPVSDLSPQLPKSALDSNKVSPTCSHFSWQYSEILFFPTRHQQHFHISQTFRRRKLNFAGKKNLIVAILTLIFLLSSGDGKSIRDMICSRAWWSVRKGF